MSGRTNYTKVQNTDPMQGPAQITSVYQHFDPLIGETVAAENQLPGSGSWPGRTIFVTGTNAQYVWSGSAWLQTFAAGTGTMSDVFAAASGWSLGVQTVEVRSGLAIGRINFERTGGTITVRADGDIPNQTIATWNRDEYKSPIGTIMTGPLSEGRLTGGELSPDLGLRLNAVAPGGDINNGSSWSLGGAWFVAV